MWLWTVASYAAGPLHSDIGVGDFQAESILDLLAVHLTLANL
jgi:hypothetical protein